MTLTKDGRRQLRQIEKQTKRQERREWLTQDTDAKLAGAGGYLAMTLVWLSVVVGALDTKDPIAYCLFASGVYVGALVGLSVVLYEVLKTRDRRRQ